MNQTNATIPLLTIVIPTRNRVSYAISAIQSILEINDARLELAVQDNSDTNELEVWIRANIEDDRLRYNYIPQPLSFVENFSAAIELTRGEYVCLIGDDDGINPEILDATEWIKRESIDCLSLKTKANYVWPNAGIPRTLFTKVTEGILSVSSFNGYLTIAYTEKELQSFLHDGGVNYLNFNLPKLYHGIVRRYCLEVIKGKTGSYFGGLTPDIFASLAIACVTKRIVVTDYPLTIPGVCGVSASIKEGLLKKNSKILEDAPHFRNRGEYQWCEFVPRIYTVETLWADSGIAALRAMGRNDLVLQINLPRMAAYCIIENKGVVKLAVQDLFRGLRIMKKNLIFGAIRFVGNIILLQEGLWLKLMMRIWNRFLMIIGIRIVSSINGLDNMVEASHALSHYLKENGHNFFVYLQQRTER